MSALKPSNSRVLSPSLKSFLLIIKPSNLSQDIHGHSKHEVHLFVEGGHAIRGRSWKAWQGTKELKAKLKEHMDAYN